jgi:hypothetical protein
MTNLTAVAWPASQTGWSARLARRKLPGSPVIHYRNWWIEHRGTGTVMKEYVWENIDVEKPAGGYGSLTFRKRVPCGFLYKDVTMDRLGSA